MVRLLTTASVLALSAASTMADPSLTYAPAPTGIAATDTANLQAALTAAAGMVVIPGGTYATNAPASIHSGTRVLCSPGTIIQPVAVASFSGNVAITNQNNTATTLTDSNITVEGCTVDATNWPASPGHKAFYFQAVNHVRVIQPHCPNGPGDCTAMVGSSDTWVEQGSASGMLNACWDHWQGAQNVHVVGGACSTALYGTLATGANSTESDNGAGVTGGVWIDGGVINVASSTPGAAPIWIQACGSGTGCVGDQVNATHIHGVTINSSNVGTSVGILVTGAGRNTTITDIIFTGEYQDSLIKTGSDSSGGPAANTLISGVIFDHIQMDVARPLVKLEGDSDAIFGSIFTGGTGFNYNIELLGNNETAQSNRYLTVGTLGVAYVAGNNNIAK